MENDVIAVSTGSVPTYPVPNDVVAEAMQGVRWSNAYGTDVPGQYRDAAVLLASGEGLGIEQITHLSGLSRTAGLTASTNGGEAGWNAGESGYPSRERILAALAGGTVLREWGEGVRTSLLEQQDRVEQAMLASIDHDPRSYDYLGLCAAGDPDVVTDLVRGAMHASGEIIWERWFPSDQRWESISSQTACSYPAVEPDAPMLAAIVGAVNAGDKLKLVYADPATFLPEGVVAGAMPDDVDDTVIAAVVDDLDPTAVWTAIRIDPGPKVAIRAGGQWAYDHVPDSLSRIVVLDQSTADAVVAAVDAVSPGTDVPMDVGPDQTTFGVPLSDFPAAIDRMFGRILAAASYTSDDEDEEDDYETKTKRREDSRAMVSDIETLREWAVLKATRDITAAHANPFAKPIVAQALGGPDRNRGGAEHLRRYWTRGRGALKIRWGTHGDWRRCYRQLFKHMGPRAAGWCQLRHKEQTGMYTGNRAHRAGVSTIKSDAALTAAYTGNGGMIALVPTDEDLDRLTFDGGEERDEIHLTLWFLGDSDRYDAENRAKTIERIRMSLDRENPGPLEANIFGVAHWNPNGEDPCWVWNVGDSDGDGGLSMFRDLIGDTWRGADMVTPPPPAQHTPWVPHITATFADVNGGDVQALVDRVGPLTFDRVRVQFHQDVVDIPLNRDDPVSRYYTEDELRAIGTSVFTDQSMGVSR